MNMYQIYQVEGVSTVGRNFDGHVGSDVESTKVQRAPLSAHRHMLAVSFTALLPTVTLLLSSMDRPSPCVDPTNS
jgi:hypothetical protein